MVIDYLNSQHGLTILVPFLISSIYISSSINHFIDLNENEKPKAWAYPGIFAFSYLSQHLFSTNFYRAIIIALY